MALKTEKQQETYFCLMKSAPVQNSFSFAPYKSAFFILLIITSFVFLNLNSYSQDTSGNISPVISNSLQGSLTSFSAAPNKNRIRLVAIGNVVGYSAVMAGLYSAWYKDYPQTGFHTFNDSREWLQVDKVGHLYSSYIASRGSMELWRWTGIERKKRIWIGGMSGAAYLTIIETLDGFSQKWGWSWSDFATNILGSGALVAQELAWDDQRIKLKFSFHKKVYGESQLNERSDELFGKTNLERLLKDYNGQTYWASINLKPFFKNSKLPEWLSLSVGYGAEGLFGGEQNIGTDKNGNIVFDRTDIKRYRQWFLAPDIDLSKIKTNKKGVKFLLTFLSSFKFPAPSLEFSNGKLRAHAIHF